MKKCGFSWNFRPTLDLLEAFFVADLLIALFYFAHQNGLGGPGNPEKVLTLLAAINAPLLLLFCVNLVLEFLRKFGKIVDLGDVVGSNVFCGVIGLVAMPITEVSLPNILFLAVSALAHLSALYCVSKRL